MPYADPEAKRQRDREYYRERRDDRLAYIKNWQNENRERVRAYKDKWKENNPSYHHDWYLANRGRSLARAKSNAKRRLEENPERIRAMQRNAVARRRARQREAFVENVDSRVVWERDRGICGICGEPADAGDWHVDHVIPIARGGEHSYANVQVSHPYCNRSKAAS